MFKLTAALCLLLFAIPKINAQCNASFTVSVSGLNVSFTPNTVGPGIYHEWQISSTTSTATYPVITVPYYTGYMARHILIDTNALCRDTVYQGVDLTDSSCKAIFSVVKDSIQNNLYKLRSLSTALGGTIYSYRWNVDGVTTGNKDTLSLVLNPGNHTICLKIQSTNFCSNETCYQLNVPTVSVCPFNVDFSYATYPFQPAKAYFSQTPNNPNFIYKWEFGDGTTATGMYPSHVYNLTTNPYGSYGVKLTVTDPSVPCVKSRNYITYILPTCTYNLLATPDDDTAGLYHLLPTPTILVSGTWTIANLNDTSQKTVVNGFLYDYQFTQSGSYLVCYHGMTYANCAVDKCDTIQVTMPIHRDAATETIVSAPNPVQSFAEFTCQLDQSGQVSVSVYSGNGVVLKTMRFAGVQGSNRFRIPVGQLPRGQYFVDIQAVSQRFKGLFQKL